MNYHFPDVGKQNLFHFIFLLLLIVLSLVLFPTLAFWEACNKSERF